MRKHFSDLPLLIKGSRCGWFQGTAEWDEDGQIERIWLAPDNLEDKDVLLTMKDRDWFALFNAALSTRYADEIALWRATKKERAFADHCDLKQRQAQEAR